MMTENSGVVHPELVERFAKAFADFVSEAAIAGKEAAMNPALSSQPSLLAWQTRALPLLEEQNRAIQKGVALYHAGDAHTIVQLADRTSGLDKQLDGYPFDFAGPQHAKELERLEMEIAMAADQLCIAAS